MATVSLNLDVSANGLKGLVELSAQFNKNMQAGATAMGKPVTAVQGGTASSRAMSSGATGGSSYVAAKAENTGYNTQRAVGGSTGSATSDFARQASGLGGLVHVYATFAANMFAVSAGFNALSKAMDTSNLVKGLDQIGAASGRNLGSLAKQMVATTNGAISLQQAMTSTAMASSGGMTNDAILRMTEVAKKASLALGRDMTDSMDRLTKGIVKTQPELLDELGIMTRVIPAQQAYAQQIGKTVASLTDFEKRQAFANAVLTEGEKKFGSINLDTNPYSKILASVQNLMQSGLELVNKVLGPLLNALSQSPTGLITVMAGIGAVLLKQAIPALGMFREQAKQAQEDAHNRMQKMVKLQQDAAAESDSIAATAAEKAFQREKKTQDAVTDLQKARFNKKLVGTDNRTSLTKSPFDISDKEMGDLRTKADMLLAHDDETYKRQGEKLTAHLDSVDKLKLERSKRGDDAAAKSEANDAKWYSHQEQLAAKAKKLAQSAAKSDVLSGVADTAATFGPVAAFKSLREETSKLDMGKVAKGITLFQGSLSIATSAISTAIGAFGVWAQVIGLAIAGFQILDGWMTSSAKESEAYGVSLTSLTSSIENVTKTLEVINAKDLNEFLSVESSQAKANALNELSASISGMLTKFDKLKSAQDNWDKFFDSLWSVVGKGSSDKLANGLSSSVIEAFKAMEEGPAKEKAKAAIQDIVGQNIDLNSFKAINAAISDLPIDDMISKGKQIDESFKTSAREAGNAASALTGFKTALADVSKQSTTMSNSLMPTDEFSKLGIEVSKTAKTMGEALKGKDGPVDGLIALKELSGDMRTLSLLPPGTAKDLANARKEIESVSLILADARKEQADAEAKIAKAKEVIRDKGGATIKGEQAQEVIDTETVRSNLAKGRELASLKNAEEINKRFSSIPQMFAQISYDNLAKGLNKALSEAAVSAAKGYLDVIKGAGGSTAEADATLNIKSIDIQIEDIKAKYKNSEKLQELTIAVEQNTAIQDRASLLASRDTIARQGGDVTGIDAKVLELNKTIVTLSSALNTAKGGSKAILDVNKASAKGDEGATGIVKALGSLATEAFGKESALAKLFSDRGNAELQKKVGYFTDAKAAQVALIDIQDKITNRLLAENNIAISINGEYSSTLQAKKQELEQTILISKAKKDELDMGAKIAAATIAATGAKDPKTRAMAEALATRLVNDLLEGRAKLESDLSTKSIKDLETRLAGENSIQKTKNDNLDLVRKEMTTIADATTVYQETELSHLKDIGALSEEAYLAKKKTIDLNKQEQDFLNQRADLDRKHVDDTKAIQDAKTVKITASADLMGPVDTSVEDAKLKQLDESYARQISAQNILNAAKAQGITLSADTTMLLAQQAERMAKLVDITTSLSAVFGDLGTNIGKSVESMQSLADNAEKRKQAEKELGGAGNEKELAALKKKNAKAELTDIAGVASATKKMFGEKTAAYKVLDSAEKAIHTYKLLMDSKEMAMDMLKTGQAIANSFARMTATEAEAVTDGTAAVVNQGKGDPYTSFARMAAMAVFVASILGGSSSGGGSPPAIDQGTLAGTGQQVGADGQTIGTRAGGVLGDPKATAKSVTDSVDGLSKVFFDNMGSASSNLIKHLKGIQENTYDTAKALGAAGFIGSDNPFGATTGSSKAFSTGIGLLDNVMGSIFGGNTSSSVTGSGIRGYGTSTGLANDASGIKGYTNVHSETSGGWFSSGSSSDTTQMTTLDKSITKGISGIFKNFNSILLDTATGLGKSRSEIQGILDTTMIDLNVSNKGLTGTEFAAKLSAEVSIQLNTIAEKAYPFLSLYTKVGEESFQTATRLIKDSETVTFGLKMVGKALTDTTTMDKIATQQQIIKNFGGTTDEFAAAIQAYYDGMFTDSEKLTTSFSSVQSQLADLGISGVTTNNQLKNLIQSLDPSSELYASLIKLVPAFTNVTAAMDKMQGQLDNLMTQVYDLTDNIAASLALKRATTLKGTDPSLKNLQKYVFALEDLKAAEAKLATVRKNNLTITKKATDDQVTSLKTSISTMDSFINSLDSFNNSLNIGAQSTLTPSEKYVASKQQFTDVLGVANSTGTSTTEIAARNLALSQIQGAATSFLDASKMYNASSSQYSADFSLVQTSITSTSSTLKVQKSTTQLTLDEITLQSTLMQDQLDVLNSTVTAVQDESAAMQAVAEASVTAQILSVSAASDQASMDAVISQTLLLSAVTATNNASSAITSAIGTASASANNISSQAARSAQAAADAANAALSRGGNGSSTGGGVGGVLGGVIGGAYGIVTNVVDTVSNAVSSIGRIFGLASGGVGSGMNLVGEHGPELVDFKTPGRVYNAENTKRLMAGRQGNNDDMVAEIRALRNEVAALRKDQKEQTGHIITTNYEANIKAADRIAGATEDAAATSAWRNRSSVTIM